MVTRKEGGQKIQAVALTGSMHRGMRCDLESPRLPGLADGKSGVRGSVLYYQRQSLLLTHRPCPSIRRLGRGGQRLRSGKGKAALALHEVPSSGHDQLLVSLGGKGSGVRTWSFTSEAACLLPSELGVHAMTPSSPPSPPRSITPRTVSHVCSPLSP